MAKKQYQRDNAEKIFKILLNRFGSGVQGHQAMMRFEKRRQRQDETIDKFLDVLEMLGRLSQPDESNRRMNLTVASKFIDGVKNDGLRTMLATHYTPLSSIAPTPEELRLKSKEYPLLKPSPISGYYKTLMAIPGDQEPKSVRALLTTGGPRIKKLHRRYVEVNGPYQVILNVDGISIYTGTYVTTDSYQIGQIYLGQE